MSDGTPGDQLDVACYHYEPVKAPLLRDAVLPAVARCAGRGIAAHVERHWQHGPHLRVRLSGRAADLTGPAAEVADALRGHLDVAPSRAAITEAELWEAARIAGREELVPPPYTPIHPDNTVRVEAVDNTALAVLLGSPGAVECRMSLLRLGVPVLGHAADHLCAQRDPGGARVKLALTAIATHAGRYPPGLGGGYRSFRSHLEDFLLHHDPEGQMEAAFADRWERSAAQVTGLVARLADARPATAAEAAWLAWSECSWSITAPAQARGEFSGYHDRVRQADLDGFPHPDHFVAYRFSTDILYHLIGVLDVCPVERHLAAYLFSRAAERVLGITWPERFAGLAAARAEAS